MAWAEKTFFNVKDDTVPKNESSDDRINRILKDLPPFMKLTSRKARKLLVRYEDLKQRHIENLRNNHVFKFVMKVAGFTNERIEKFWKGADISPFMEKYTPQNIKITKEDLDILVLRAREHALSDLHQFCTELVAIPLYRPAQEGEGRIDPDPNVNIPDHSALPDPNSGGKPNPKLKSQREYIYNMTDSEFLVFCKKFLLMKKTLGKAYDENDIIWYLLKDDSDDPQYTREVYDHTKLFDKDEKQVESYNMSFYKSLDLEPEDMDKDGKEGLQNYWTWMDNTPIIHWDKTTAEFWFQRYVAKWLAEDYPKAERNGEPIMPPRDSKLKNKFKDLTDFRNRFRNLFNNLRLDKSTGKWMRDLTGLRLTKMIRGRKEFKDRGVGLGRDAPVVNNPSEEGGPLAPQRMRRSSSMGVPVNRLNNKDKSGIAVGVTNFEDPERIEGELDTWRPEDLPTEVPLDFVRPIFNERFAHWKHELVLGEYEKRSMQEADKWLQMTPWAIGKIYLQPSIFAHMQEAHIAITKKFKKFQHLTLEDWLGSEDHSFFFSKLVALCIKTSDILSGKKYGLDKMYMRINLEKRRIMYSIGKLDVPRRVRGTSAGTSTRAPSDKRLWRDYEDARKRGDADAAAHALAGMRRPF